MVRLSRCGDVDDRVDGEKSPRLVGDITVDKAAKSNVLSGLSRWGVENAELKESSDSERLRLRTIMS